MTVLIYCSCMFRHFCLSQQSMEKSSIKTSKSSSATSTLSTNGRLRSYSVLPRHNSFSSCSNDSSVSNNSVQTRFRNAKRMLADESVQPRKRSRNSSGSSLSSNISGMSDKDLKSSGIISQTEAEMKSYISNNQKSPFLNYSKVNSSRMKLKEKNVNDQFDCTENSLVAVPNQHNLRGKITKKGCTCCPSTCATVVFRRYKKYVKSGEEKTVISSTKVRTYIKKTPPPNLSKVNAKNNSDNNPPNTSNNNTPCNKSRNRKRKSEVEKLYESLHEIEWAKNFSPDNILRQISIRQAAACSVFGHSQTNSIHFPKKNTKKQDAGDLDDNINSSSMKSEISEIDHETIESSSCEVISNVNKETHIVSNCDNEQMPDLHTAQITTSVNISSCSMSHLNVKEISINTRETVHSGPLMIENDANYSDDAQLSYTSDESSSAISSSIVSLQSKHSLDFSYTGRKKNSSLSDIDIPEYSATATFFDIAEEGIRTIDACFREVGAEVVVSTCYEDESSLPLLTSVKENKISSKILNDSPPILEPCIDVSFSCEKSSMQKHDKQCKKEKVEYYSKEFDVTNKSRVFRRINSCFSNYQSVLLPKTFKKSIASSKYYYNKLRTARKVVKKYLKLLLNKSRLKYLFKDKIKDSTGVKFTNGLNVCFNDRNTSELNKNKSSILIQNAVLSAHLSKSHSISCDLTDTKSNKMTFRQTRNKKYSSNIKDKVMCDFVKNGSCLYNRKELKYPAETKEISIVSQTQSNAATHSRSRVSSFVSAQVESDETVDEQIARPPHFYGYSSDYKSIRVHRNHNYTHVILLVTRGKSIFLTLEVLTELRDVLIRSNNDSNCPVLIINGVGDSFCSGLDVMSLVGPRKKLACTELAIAIKGFIEALSDFKKPLAAVVNGPALGLGMTLLNHIDMIIASEKATFCMPYSLLGYMPEGGATLTLPQIVGSTVAMDLLIRGKTLTAREACNVGLISEVHEARLLPHELVSRLRSLAEKPLSALETTKALLKMQLHLNLRLVLENEVKLLPRMWLTRTCQDSLRKALDSGILSE